MKINDTKPRLFEKTNSNIWTDPYIGRQMLAAHLDQDSDAASRKRESIWKITDFIVSRSKPAGRLLDLGCGPGLYTTLFKDKCYEVTGVDFNRASIEYAAAQREDIRYILGDYIAEYPAGKYDTVMMIYCDFGTHSDSDRDKLLKNIHRSLDEGGVFIFDVFTEGMATERREERNWDYAPAGGFWGKDEYLLLSQTFHYPDDHAFATQYNLLAKDEARHFIIWDRYYLEEEIISVLENAGFRKVTVHRNFLPGNNFISDSEMFVVAEK